MNPGSDSPLFRLVFNGQVGDELRQLAERAIAFGIRSRFAESLNTIRFALTTDPLNWGDPLYPLRGLGLMVYHRIHDDVIVGYAVNEAERIVWLSHALPIFGHPLNPDSPGGT